MGCVRGVWSEKGEGGETKWLARCSDRRKKQTRQRPLALSPRTGPMSMDVRAEAWPEHAERECTQPLVLGSQIRTKPAESPVVIVRPSAPCEAQADTRIRGQEAAVVRDAALREMSGDKEWKSALPHHTD